MSLSDSLQRSIRYLRLSVTPACSMRCLYCRPDIYEGTGGATLMNADEIGQMVRHLVTRHGLRKLRLTGGEPTARADIVRIIETVAAIPGLEDLAMTTNALTLVRQAKDFVRAGLRRINISIDSLDRERFRRMTGVDGLARVVDGIAAARAAGLGPIKLNTVVVRGENDDELGGLLRFAIEQQVELRFIELMPMGPLADRWAARYVTGAQMREAMSNVVDRFTPLPETSAAARLFEATLHDGRQATVGFVTPMSQHFCDRCDRIRIAADGSYYPCLMDAPSANLMAAIRPQFDAEQFDRLLSTGLDRKAPSHPAIGVGIMTSIGG